MNLEKNWTWACDHLKTSNLSADNFKKYLTSMGRHLSPRYGQVILVSGYPVLTAVNWSQHWCAICVQYQSSCAPKLARKCEIEHWFPCGADGRAGCGRCTVTWLPNFLGWVDLRSYGALLARALRAWSSAIITAFTAFHSSMHLFFRQLWRILKMDHLSQTDDLSLVWKRPLCAIQFKLM